MNALDQAFIKAFAKDRSPAAPTTGQAEDMRYTKDRRTRPQPPEVGVESVALVLHDLYQQGKRLRIDRPDSGSMGLDAHMILPSVEQVQSYDPAEVASATQPSVLFEDRLLPHDDAQCENGVSSAREREKLDARGVACETKPDTDSNVRRRTEANTDRDVPTLDGVVRRAASELREKEKPVSAEDRLLMQCRPTSFVATGQVDAPELVTHELSQLDCGAELPGTDVATEIEITWPELDWEALESAALMLQEQEAELSITSQTQPESSLSKPAVPLWETGPSPKTEWAETLAGEAEVAGADIDVSLEAHDDYADTMLSVSAAVDDDSPHHSDRSSPSPKVAFSPAWEVDAFRWPSLCQQLDEESGGRLTQSGEELFTATRDGLSVLAVTSSSRLEGRTTLALSLARNAARAGSRVALIDADSANPELARRLGMEAPCDWREVMGRGEPLSEAAVASLDDHVTLFPRSFPTDVPSDSLDESLSSTLAELREHFDLVVVDLPPVRPDEPAANRSHACPVDMALVVRNMQLTSQEQCLSTVATLRRLGIRAVGVIENFTQAEPAK